MSGNFKNIVLAIILIGSVAFAQAVRVKAKESKAMTYYKSSANADYEQIALTFLETTHDPLPR